MLWSDRERHRSDARPTLKRLEREGEGAEADRARSTNQAAPTARGRARLAHDCMQSTCGRRSVAESSSPRPRPEKREATPSKQHAM
jgi:hypothetical protein